MPMERMSMRHVRDCVRLKNAGISTRDIGHTPLHHLVLVDAPPKL
jgi:hypothetical protein